MELRTSWHLTRMKKRCRKKYTAIFYSQKGRYAWSYTKLEPCPVSSAFLRAPLLERELGV
jgi:hypothetical protein